MAHEAINTIFLILLSVSPFATVVCVVFMWRFIALTDVDVRHRWRKAVLCVAQALVTFAAILTLYYGLNNGGLTWPEEDQRTSRFFRTSIALAFCSLAGSLLGAGAGRKTTAASSVLVMVNWLGVAALS